MFNRRSFMIGLSAAGALGTGTVQARANPFPEKFMPQLAKPLSPAWRAGEVHVVPDDFFLYFMHTDLMAFRYGVGVGRKGLYEPGTFTMKRKAEWPRWRPTNAMIQREPHKYEQYADGMAGGPDNPLGARALYLFDDAGRDTYLRIHGTNAPGTIGTAVSNGCARLTNDHVQDLYPRVEIGARVILHPKVRTT
ncbi:L,D-transpeptidase [Oceaniovalibus sp. ACAM 378]|uniref:L,D-transpeptidase n=1 Tax=Oceaniovalibus sp. ACAM 378 TaxID=2599923 RepID=UPI00210609D6|nr:L,D-transpeptidase [Oceaniovalibus sp. ACAM 378]